MEQNRKIKVLYLGHKDSKCAGHVYYSYLTHPDYFEKRIVVHRSTGENPHVALYKENSLIYKIIYAYKVWVFKLISLFKYHEIVSIDPSHSEYCYYGNSFIHNSYKRILRKIKGFTPELIYIGWVDQFINAHDIAMLHKKTGAHIVLAFNDEAHMTGGCHYPVDCVGYQSDCSNCPALVSGKWLSQFQLKEKKELLKNIPISIIASPYDRELIKKSFLKDCNVFSSIRFPQIPQCEKEACRREFGILPNEFVIFIGCTSLKEKRKGLTYSFDAIKKVQENKENLVLLLLGNDTIDMSSLGIKARTITPGYLSTEKMCYAMKASDCFLSTTIADSGPMMVNYSIELGIPVISFKVGIACTLVSHKINGYLADLFDTEALAQGIDFIYNMSTDERDVLSQECINAFNKYNGEKSSCDQIYEKFISGELKHG